MIRMKFICANLSISIVSADELLKQIEINKYMIDKNK